MRTMARRSWSAEFSDLLKFAAVVVGVLVVAYIGYVVFIAVMGNNPNDRRKTNLEIDTGQLDRGPGNSDGELSPNLVQSEPELVGWTAGTGLTARVSLLGQNDESACFEIMTGDVYVAEVMVGGEPTYVWTSPHGTPQSRICPVAVRSSSELRRWHTRTSASRSAAPWRTCSRS